jgi:hypothetical protein
MRTLLKAQLRTDPSETTPIAVRFERIKSLLDSLKPEAMYFYPEDGVRTMLIIFDMKSPSDLPVITEPLFNAGARVEFAPVMNLEDLQAGFKKMGAAAGV